MLLTLALALVPIGDSWPPDVEEALALAGKNRPEIERVLEHYAAGGDPQELAAACFLVANMPGHGYIEYALCDADGREIPFDALAFPDFGAAQAALDALEEQHGPLDFEKRELIEDLHTLSADALIENVDLAFRAWRESSWAQDVSFETFCEHILPHRGSNEPAERWRAPLAQSLRASLSELPPDAGAPDAARLAARIAAEHVRFRELYYLHPTDQGFAEMCSAGSGRCEDITNMTTYAMRAAAVVCAADYTPWWGHRDNNHAWPVTLDGAGRGRSGDGNGAAKVYRKTYSKQRGNLCFQLADGEEAPRWLDRESYVDVTDQYGETTDVTVRLTAPRERRFAYLCVFNGGEWKPIHWGRVEDEAVTFDRMGRGLLYLPATWSDGAVQPAAPPFVLTVDGRVELLDPDYARAVDASLHAATRGAPRLDEAGHRLSRLAAGSRYELFVWRGGWQSLGEHEATSQPLSVQGLPAGGLYWLVRAGSRELERPFTLRDGEQVFR